jgi:cellulose biosynthesis protein BcsQ
MSLDDDIEVYAFYNNKGGVGKTTLCSNAVALYAEEHPQTQVLVLDMCPQANISHFLLGGGPAGFQTNQKLQMQATRRNIVGFIDWLLKGNSGFTSLKASSYQVNVSQYNENVPDNIYLVAGDSFLESLSLALNYAVINPANTLAWSEYMTALKRLCSEEFKRTEYKNLRVFIDCNPSFSIYTQMALMSSDYLVVPMMADFTSVEGIRGIFVMLYGKYPSPALQKYAQNVVTFAKQVVQFDLKPPQVYELVFNNYTSNLGVAKAYDALRAELVAFSYNQFDSFPKLFAATAAAPTSMAEWSEFYVSDVKDFHTAGKVSATLGISLVRLPLRSSYRMPDGDVVNLPPTNYTQAVKDIRDFVKKIN